MGGGESLTRTKVGNLELRALLEVERAGRACPRALDDVEVNHGGGDVSVAEKILHGADVGAALFSDTIRHPASRNLRRKAGPLKNDLANCRALWGF